MRKTSTVVLLGLAVACGSAGGDMLEEIRDGIGGMLGDAGEVMDDAGDAFHGMTDVPVARAQGLDAHPVVCDRVRTRKQRLGYDGGDFVELTYTTRFAQIEVEDFRNVGIEKCEPVGEDYQGIWGCQVSVPDGWQHDCTGLVEEQCQFSWGAEYHLGNTVYVSCDTTSETRNQDGAVSTTHHGWKQVTLYY